MKQRWRFRPDQSQRKRILELAERYQAYELALALMTVPQEAPLSEEDLVQALENPEMRQHLKQFLEYAGRRKYLSLAITIGRPIHPCALGIYRVHVGWRVFKTDGGPELLESKQYEEIKQRLLTQLEHAPSLDEVLRVVRGSFVRELEAADANYSGQIQLLEEIPEPAQELLKDKRVRVLRSFREIMDYIEDHQLLHMHSPTLRAPYAQQRIWRVLSRYQAGVLLHIEGEGFVLISPACQVAWSLAYPGSNLHYYTRRLGAIYRNFGRVLEELSGDYDDYPF